MMKRFLIIFFLILNGIAFAQSRDAEFEGGTKQLKKIILTKINLDSIDVDENTVVKLTFKIDRQGRVVVINCESDYPKTKIEFIRVATEIKQKWKPAIKNGKRVDSEIMLSIPMIFE